MAEEFGGDVQVIPISATHQINIDKLEEGKRFHYRPTVSLTVALSAILLQSDIMQLTASQDCNAEGTVLESRVGRGVGPSASVIVRCGQLRVGDCVVVGYHILLCLFLAGCTLPN